VLGCGSIEAHEFGGNAPTRLPCTRSDPEADSSVDSRLSTSSCICKTVFTTSSRIYDYRKSFSYGQFWTETAKDVAAHADRSNGKHAEASEDAEIYEE